ncbi:MAG: efflux RND transporter periplasmic adaptor subunit [Pseudolabrys sp.]|nr:efflux RND transporter periplasmic adaptor subunit [Pseudolabrys sp.]
MSPDQEQPIITRRGLRIAAVSAVVIGAVVVGLGINTRRVADARLSEWTETQALPVVAAIAPDMRRKAATLNLPGRLEADSQAQIFSRVSGYLKDLKVDIGTPVKAGQLLAEIDAPDLDQQIMQAEADVSSAQANLTLAKGILDRGRSLIESGAVSKQALDQRSADADNRQGLVRSLQANLERLRVLEKYKRIVAPFDGLVTARSTDVGALVNVGSSTGPALFVVSDITKLRGYINVPQNFVPSIKVGTKAQITVPEHRGRTFTATVEASAQAVDPQSGTTRMLLAVDNAKGELMSGAYASVQLDLPSAESAIHVPASALIFNQNGLQVATIDTEGKIALKAVTIARDLGREVEIGSGLTARDRIVASPPDGIASGDQVRIAGETKPTNTASTRKAAPGAKPPG